MKAILISIRPEWVAKILNGEKTIEIRRSKPKRELPIDVFLYCTNGKRTLRRNIINGHTDFYLDKGYGDVDLNGKVVGKFTLKKVDKFDMGNPYGEPTRCLLNEACVTLGEARTYAGGTHPRYNPLFAWHISDLEIFDEPKELGEFSYLVRKFHVDGFVVPLYGKVAKAPQSWRYVEVEE